MIVNNFELIKSLLHFDDKDDFYFCQIIQRKKDGNNVPSANNGYRTIKTYYIRSIEDFERRIPAIIQLCEQNNARAYINPNVRNAREVALQCSKAYIDLVLENRCDQGHRIYDHCCGISPKKGVKKMWIVDVDTKDEELAADVLMSINKCKSANKINDDTYDNVVAIVPTLNGFHLITCGFDKSQLKGFLTERLQGEQNEKFIDETCGSIKKDNPTLLYFRAKTKEPERAEKRSGLTVKNLKDKVKNYFHSVHVL